MSARDVIADWLSDAAIQNGFENSRGKSINDHAGDILSALEAAGYAVVPKDCLIPLTNGGFALVSEEDVERVRSAGNWFSVKKASGAYACRSFGKGNRVYMHRFITGAEEGAVVDHINGDTLDNRRGNIRVVTQAENQRNRSGAQANSKSGKRGVYFHKQRGKWAACLRKDGKNISLGLYPTIELAVKARDDAEKEWWSWQDRTRAMLTAAKETP